MSDTPAPPSVTRPRGRHIFISYSRRDTPAVVRLHAELTRAQFRLWMDTSDYGINISDNWRDSLRENMSAASVVIACLSPDFLRSEFCKAEIRQALDEHKRIYPMLMRPLGEDDAALIEAFGLKDIQYGDLTTVNNWKPSVERLKRSLPPPNRIAWLRRYAPALAAAVVSVALFFVVLRFALPADVTSSVFGMTAVPPTPIPAIRDARMGVAVTYFWLEDATIDPVQAKALVNRFAADLRPALQRAAAEAELGIGYLAPADVGEEAVSGATPAERRDSARRLVRDRGVDLVIYGWIEQPRPGELVIHPELTVIPEELAVADELADGNRFGSPIPASLANLTSAELDLRDRADVAAQIASGLAYLATEQPDGYDKAVLQFRTALEDYASAEIADVVNVLLGNTYLRRARLAWSACDAAAVLDQTTQAKAAYNQALQVESDYSRPYSGLAVATFYEARWALPEAQAPENCAIEFYDTALLVEALDLINQANTAAGAGGDDNPFVAASRATNEARIAYALCGVYLTDVLNSVTSTLDASTCARFDAAAARVLDDEEADGIYNEQPLVTILPYAALVEYMRGYLEWIRALGPDGDLATALKHYDRAVELLDAQPALNRENRYNLMLYLGARGDLNLVLCETAAARADFERAAALAGELGVDAGYFESGAADADMTQEACLALLSP